MAIKLTEYAVGLFFLTLLFAGEVRSDMYRCTVSTGQVIFTNDKAAGDCQALELPNISAPLSADYLSNQIERSIGFSALRHGVDPALIKAIIRTESSFDARAVSRKGAKGLMQLMPSTAEEMKVRDPFNPEQNIEGGTKYFRLLLDTFRQNVPLALAAYNAGPTVVQERQSIPPYPETVAYVKRVLAAYRGYKKEEG
ncbi:unnamed protein product [Cyprideis torosa]|uniref:Transglycosylase SLT domain-containing protein n=1 Tax=Cyprideis torosa TaxID=163714 RepID=A0A7R8WRJ5_9CRUS|nr:unnamed protein product [Cyprideis torosa]CAG0908805.1 unnamed protein product [Cyprideis torosa]